MLMLTRDKLFEPWRNFSCIESRVTPQSNHFSSVCEMEIWISVFITICYMLTGWQVTCSMYKQTWLITWQAAVKTLEKPLPFLNVWFFSGVCSLVLLILWSVLLLYIVIKARQLWDYDGQCWNKTPVVLIQLLQVWLCLHYVAVTVNWIRSLY